MTRTAGPCHVRAHSMRGLTLIELAVVLAILIALAAIVMPSIQDTGRHSECLATDATLVAVRDAIMGTGGQPGYLSDMGIYPKHASSSLPTNPFNLHYLFADWNGNIDQAGNACFTVGPDDPNCEHMRRFNPIIQRGWRGPYLSQGATCGSLLTRELVTPCPLQLSPLYSVCRLGVITKACSSDLDCNGGQCSSCGQCSVLPPGVTPPGVPLGLRVALDGFRNMGVGSTTSIRSPIQLFTDAKGQHYLVSAGPDGLTRLANGIDPENSPNRNIRGDDRVLYLDGSDRWSNQPCTD